MTYKEAKYTWSEGATVQIEEYNPRKIFSSLTLTIDMDESEANLQIRTLMDKVRYLVREDIDQQIASLMDLRDEGPLEEFVKDTGAQLTVDPESGQLEEQPPLPSEPVDLAATSEFQGDGYRRFKVKSIEVAMNASEDKYLKVYGWPTKGKKDWVACWQAVGGDLLGDFTELDLGTFPPPFDVNAVVEMGEYKGRPSPGTVVGWEKIA